MKETVLKASKGWIIATLIFALIFIIPISFGEYYFISNIFKAANKSAAIQSTLIMQLVFIPFLLLSIGGLLQIFRSYIIIRENEFEYHSGLFKHVTISANQIKSWFLTQQYTLNVHIIYSENFEKEKKIKIEMIYENNENFTNWLEEHYGLPGSASFNKSIEEEIKNDNEKISDNDLQNLIPKYTKIAKYYNNIGMLLATAQLIMLIFLDYKLWFIKFCFIFNFLYSFAGFILIKVSKEIIRFDEYHGQKYPSIFKGMILCPLMNVVFSIACIEQIVNIKKYFLVACLAFIIFVVIINLVKFNQLNFSKNKNGKKASIVCFYLIFLFIIFCSVPGVNHFFCISKNYESFIVTVEDKKSDDDLIVSNWFNSEKTKTINISKSSFNKIEVGNELEIRIKKGLLGIEFFTYKIIK